MSEQQIIIFTAIPILTFLGGGLLSIFFKPSAAFRSVILHFAGGVIFSVVAVEILPDVVESHKPLLVASGFIAGMLTMLFIKEFAERSERASHDTALLPRVPMGFIVAIGVDVVIDGLLLGIGFATGTKAGILLAIALALEMLSMGVAVGTQLGEKGIAKGVSIRHVAALSMLFLVSAVLGVTLLQHLPHTIMQLVLSFGLSALLYLVTEELLVEAHSTEDKPLYTATFFVGFLIFLLLAMMEF